MHTPDWIQKLYEEGALVADVRHYYAWSKPQDEYGTGNMETVCEELALVGWEPDQVPDENYQMCYRSYLGENNISTEDLKNARDAVKTASAKLYIRSVFDAMFCELNDQINCDSLLEYESHLNSLVSVLRPVIDRWNNPPEFERLEGPTMRGLEQALQCAEEFIKGENTANKQEPPLLINGKENADKLRSLSDEHLCEMYNHIGTFATMRKDDRRGGFPEGYGIPSDEAVDVLHRMINFARDAMGELSPPETKDEFEPTPLEYWKSLRPLTNLEGQYLYYRAPGFSKSGLAYDENMAIANGVIMGQALNMMKTLSMIRKEVSTVDSPFALKVQVLTDEALDLVNDEIDAAVVSAKINNS